MPGHQNATRRREILSAVLKVIKERGVSGATTARIAAEAHCSKETIYNWFGDRTGLFSALVEEQSRAMNEMLADTLSTTPDVRISLVKFASALLDLLTGEASLLINRAAIAGMGEANELANIVLLRGRGETLPLVQSLLVRARDQGLIQFDDTEEVVSTFYGLIMADRQMKAVLGDSKSRPEGSEMTPLAERSVERLFLIYQG